MSSQCPATSPLQYNHACAMNIFKIYCWPASALSTCFCISRCIHVGTPNGHFHAVSVASFFQKHDIPARTRKTTARARVPLPPNRRLDDTSCTCDLDTERVRSVVLHQPTTPVCRATYSYSNVVRTY